MTMRVMLDTDQPGQLTAAGVRAPILATYADLMTAADLAGLRAAWGQVLLIDRGQGDPLGRSSVIDVERGTHGPGDAPGWFDRQTARGVAQLTVYADRSSQAAVNKAMGGRRFFRWIATLDGTLHVAPYAPGKQPAAVQVLGAGSLGFHADLSIVLESWWNRAPAAAAAAPAWVGPALSAVKHATANLDAAVQDLTALATVMAAHQ